MLRHPSVGTDSYKNFMNEKLFDAVYGCLIGGAIGDALGVVSTTLVVTVATPAAYAAAHLRFKKKSFLLSLLVGRMMPAVALVVPSYLIASRWHLLDTYQILISINVAFNLPFTIWLMRGFFGIFRGNSVKQQLWMDVRSLQLFGQSSSL
jgi:ABC-type glycerol-3-phosphate transport system permease component